MKLENNPLLKQENYAAQYNESIEKLKNNPELISFDKLCYELFHGTEIGKEFMNLVVERYLIPPMSNRDAPNFDKMAIWGEGFKDAFRMIRQSVKSHEQRIKAENSK